MYLETCTSRKKRKRSDNFGVVMSSVWGLLSMLTGHYNGGIQQVVQNEN